MRLELENTHNGTPIRWFALVNYYKNMHADIYLKISGHLVEPLYLLTPIEPLLNRSPLVISLYKQDPIIEKLPKESTLYFSALANTSFEEILKNLRNKLKIQFSGNRKGIFHYYLPSVASYFFSFSTPNDSANWLHGFSSMYLYRQIKSQPPSWIKIEGESKKKPSPIWLITESQENALNEKFQEKNISQWSEVENIPFFDWKKQKTVDPFCSQYQINDPQLVIQVRNLVQHHDIALNQIRFMPSHPQHPEGIVKQLEIWISEEYKNVD